MVDKTMLSSMMMKTIFELQRRKAFKRRFMRKQTIARLEMIVSDIIEENVEFNELLERMR